MAEKMTITEALAEVPLIDKKVRQAQENILRYLARPEDRKDPHEEKGGSEQYIEGQLKSIEDNLSRMVRIRKAIAGANSGNKVTVSSTTLEKEYTKSIEAWLIWRREVYPRQKNLYHHMMRRIDNERKGDRRDITSRGLGLDDFRVRTGLRRDTQTDYPGAKDVTVEYDEQHLANLIDGLEEVNGTLDGRLTLFNSTVEIEF
ncbi:MAG: hypothetical protein ACXABN_16950 [Candidatus Thorarchaeota archaeon]|jgi:hypothetical protein